VQELKQEKDKDISIKDKEISELKQSIKYLKQLFETFQK
jgi:hypothetical protein